MAKSDDLQELQGIRNFLSDCYSFIRAEITSEEIGTFGLADQISARIQAIGAPSTTGTSDLSMIDRMEALTGQIEGMVADAKVLQPYEDVRPTGPDEWPIEGPLGFSKDDSALDPTLEDRVLAMFDDIASDSSAKTNANDITNDQPPGSKVS